MQYHQERFEDFSLIVFKEGNPVALFPANKVENIIYSHQGLTFGSLILPKKISLFDVSLIFNAICEFYKKILITEINIKQIPEIYFSIPSNELSYILLKKGKLTKREMVLSIDYNKPLQIHKTKLKHYRKGEELGFEIVESDDFKHFWSHVLEPRLFEKHNTKPVHKVNEIELLKSLFSRNIKQFNIYLKEELLAGITIFENETVVKSQYGATTLEGEKVRALDFLFLHLIYKYKKEGKSFFSMGTVTETNDLGYNKGLLKQKEELGCQIVLQDFFTLEL